MSLDIKENGMKFSQITDALYNGLKVSRKAWNSSHYMQYDRKSSQISKKPFTSYELSGYELVEATDWYIVKDEYGFRDALKFIKENKGSKMTSKYGTYHFNRFGELINNDGEPVVVNEELLDVKWTVE